MKSAPNHEDVARRVSNHAFGDTSDQPPLHASAPMRANDDEIGAVAVRVLANRLGWGVVREHGELDVDVSQMFVA